MRTMSNAARTGRILRLLAIICCGCLGLSLTVCHGFSWKPPLTRTRETPQKSFSRTLLSNGDSRTKLKAVKFYYSPSSLQHLSRLEKPKQQDGTVATRSSSQQASTWSTEKSIAAGGALIGSAIVAYIGFLVFGEDRGDIAFFFSGMGGALGWTLLGGTKVRKDDLPTDGGTDGQFVVDRPSRLKSILNKVPSRQVVQSNSNRDLSKAIEYIEKVHGFTYLKYLQDAVKDARQSGRLRRLVPSYARTLIDEHSYGAAVEGVADWISAVDGGGFALVRPPTHHACKEKGMGGCLINGVAAAAFYALTKTTGKVAILDIDAHYGNGIAHCIQDEPRLLYCSLHEDLSTNNKGHYMFAKRQNPNDPRSPLASDKGPLGNCLNVLVPTGATWDTYKELLETQALPFLEQADFLLVAAGFDALQADQTSGLCLEPQDYQKLGLLLKQSKFGKGISLAFGLEGGYCWENGELAQAVVNLVKPFN